jgi:hypothetical protein
MILFEEGRYSANLRQSVQLNADYTFDMLRTGITKARHGVALLCLIEPPQRIIIQCKPIRAGLEIILTG